MARRQNRHERLPQNGLDREAVACFAIAEKAEIQCAIQQEGHQFFGGALAQAELDVGVHMPVAPDGFRQACKHDGTGEPYGERALQSAAHAARHLDVVRYFGKRSSRALQEELPHPSESDAAGRAVEEGVAQVALQVTDLLTERRLRHPQLLRRMSEVQRLGDCSEVAQVPQLDLVIHMLFVSV